MQSTFVRCGSISSVSVNLLVVFIVTAAALILTLPAMGADVITIVPSISTVAGNGNSGYTGDGGAAVSATLSQPHAAVLDAFGNIYISDQGNSVIRVVNTQASAITVFGVTIRPGSIETVAGTGANAYNGDGPALSVNIAPAGIALDNAGILYIVDRGNNLVRKLDATGSLTTVAGMHTGTVCGTAANALGDGCPATAAKLNKPQYIAFDHVGNLYVADQGNNVVRVINMQAGAATILGILVEPGNIATVAGNGTPGYTGNGGAAISAQLSAPTGVTLDAKGNLYIADSINNAIRRVDADAYTISTAIGNGACGYTGDYGPAETAQICKPMGIMVDAAGNGYIADQGNNVIRKVDASDGFIYTVAGNATTAGTYAGDGGPAVFASFFAPSSVFVDSNGALYVTDKRNNAIRKVESSTAPVNFAATAVGSSAAPKNLFLAINYASTLRAVIPNSQGGKAEFTLQDPPSSNCTMDGATLIAAGTICTVPITFTPGYAGLRQVPFAVLANITNPPIGSRIVIFGLNGIGLGPQLTFTPGRITTFAGNISLGDGYSGDGGAASEAQLYRPHGIAFDFAGNLYIADSWNNVVRKVNATTQQIETVAGDYSNAGYGGDNGPATAASLSAPAGVAVDALGNLYITDTHNGRIRRVDLSGMITTVAGGDGSVCGNAINSIGDGCPATAAQLTLPRSVAVDKAGNLYIADGNNSVVRRVDAATQIITTVAGNSLLGPGYGGDGGPATNAQLSMPWGLALNAAGDLYISDMGNNVVRRVDAATQIITTVAGDQSSGGNYGGDGGPATGAQMNAPHGVAVDAAGNLYIADIGNDVIRRVDAATQVISTVVGDNTIGYGYSGDGGSATAAQLAGPVNIAIDPSGNLYISDVYNGLIRVVSASSSLVFPVTVIGNVSAEQTVTALNIGNQSLTLSGVGLTTPNFKLNAASSSCSTLVDSAAPLAAGATCTATAYFLPSTWGLLEDNLVFTDDALKVSGSVALSGRGIATSVPEIVLSFGATVVTFSGSTPLSFTINNPVDGVPLTGLEFTDNLQGLIVAASPNVSNTCGGSVAAAPGSSSITLSAGTLAPGSSCVVSVNVQGALMGTQDNSVTLFSDQGGTGNTASGSVTVIGPPVLSQAFSMPSMGVNDTTTLTFNITNNNAGTDLTGIGFTDTLPAGLTIATPSNLGGDCDGMAEAAEGTNLITLSGASLSAGASCSLSVDVTATAAGLQTNHTSSVTSNEGGTGSATAASLMVVGAPLPPVPVTIAPAIKSVAGNYDLGSGYGGDNGPATVAQLGDPNAATVDAAGNIYIADQWNSRIRVVNTQKSAITVFGVTIQPGNIATVAGTGHAGYDGDGPAISRTLYYPAGLALDAVGNLYVADMGDSGPGGNCLIRKIDTAGYLTTVAGNHTLGCEYSGDGGPANKAQLSKPRDIALDSAGNLYIADQANNVIRAVNMQASSATILGVLVAPGDIVTVAGNYSLGAGYSGDGGPATQAQLDFPAGLTLDRAGNLYIADMNNCVIRSVDAVTHSMSTVAGSSIDGCGYSGDGDAAAAAQLNSPRGVAVDAAGNLYISDTYNYAIRVVNMQNTAIAVAGVMIQPGSIATIAGDGSSSFGDGGPAIHASFDYPTYVALDQRGAIYVTDKLNDVIRKIDSSAAPVHLGTTAVGSSLTPTGDPCEKGCGYVWINTDLSMNAPLAPSSQGAKQEFTPQSSPDCSLDGSTTISAGTVCTVPVTFEPAYAGLRQEPLILETSVGNFQFGLSGTGLAPQVAVIPGQISTIAGNYSLGAGYSGDNAAATDARLSAPQGVAINGMGDLYIADKANHVVRMVSADTQMITTVAGDNTTGPGYSGDGGPAISAQLNNPSAMALDAAGNLYIADEANNVVRKLDAATQIVTTVAGNHALGAGYSGDGANAGFAQLNAPRQLAVDASGNVYIADTANNVVRKVDASTHVITTIAGNHSLGAGYAGDHGLAVAARLNAPAGVTVDSAGNVYIADTGNNVIRKVDVATQTISTVVGNNGVGGGYSGDGGPATSAALNGPRELAVDAAGNLYIADVGNNVIRKVDAATQTINTVAGNNSLGGTYGEATSSTAAGFNQPVSVTVDGVGNLYISDSQNNAIRKVSVSGAVIFPATSVGSQSVAQAITASNIGNMALSFSPPVAPATNPGLSTGTNFVIDSTTCSAGTALTAGASCAVNVYFKPTAEGSLTDTLSFADDALAGSGPQTAAISGTAQSQQSQTIDFTISGTHYYGEVLTLTATATSGLPVSFNVTSGPATVNGNSLTITGTGNVTVEATQLGDTQWNAAAPLSVTFMANPRAATVTPAAASKTYGTADPVLTGTLTGFVAGDNVTASYSRAVGETAAQGPYTISATLSPAAVLGNYAITYNTAQFTIDKAGSRAALQTSSASVLLRNAVTITAHVSSSSSGTPTGSVNFLDGSTLLGTGALDNTGTATLNVSTLSVGQHSITAEYLGDGNFTGITSGAVSELVQDFQLAATGGSAATVRPGGVANYQLQLSPTNGTSFPSSVALALSNLPSGATYTITPEAIATGDGTTSFTVSVQTANRTASLPASRRTLNGALFALALAFPGLGLIWLQGKAKRSSRTVVLGMLLLLAMVGLLSSCGSGGSSAPPNTPPANPQPQTYNLTLTATSGELQHSTTLTLTIE